MGDHGAAFEGSDGSESDEEKDGGDEWAAGEMFGEQAFLDHGVLKIPGLWEETNAEALRRAAVYDCDPIPSSLTPVDMMLLNISKKYGTPLSAMKEVDHVLSAVIQLCVDSGLPAESVPHIFTRADIRENEFKRVVSEDSPYVTCRVHMLVCLFLSLVRSRPFACVDN